MENFWRDVCFYHVGVDILKAKMAKNKDKLILTQQLMKIQKKLYFN